LNVSEGSIRWRIKSRTVPHHCTISWRSRDSNTRPESYNGSTRTFTGKSLLLTFSVPQFFFHVTTAYDILRHNGVGLVKKNFLGPPKTA
jgi:hypothetical protein